MMKTINFSKLNGQGNDFIIIEDLKDNLKLKKKDIIKFCDRRFGVGADGLILIKKSDVADFKMDYFNSDGSPAEMCGNGIRCMARYINDNDLKKENILKIETLAGIRVINTSLENTRFYAEVNMGKPFFDPLEVPLNDSFKGREALLEYPVEVGDRNFNINCVSIGNPHCVVILKENDDLETFNLKKYGEKLENHDFFPRKTNVEFIKIKSDEEISMRVWERGAGETLACGTGACASAVACMKLKKISSQRVKVFLPGGILEIFWDVNNTGDIFLKGEVNYVFDGRYYN
jgi:diaminopimelate epimerase